MINSEDKFNNEIAAFNKEEANQLSLRNVFNIMFRHKLKIILVFVVIVAVVTVFILRKPVVYESQAKLLVKPGREKISWDASMLGLGPSLSLNNTVDLGSELIILQSGPVIAEVVDRIGPEALTEPSVEDNTPQELREKAIISVMSKLNVGVEMEATHINLSFLAKSPLLARKVLDNVIVVYMERRIEVFRDKVVSKFLSGQVETALSKLEKREEEFKQFRNKRGIVSMEGQKKTFLEQIADLTTRMDNINLQINSAQSSVIVLEKNLQESPDVAVKLDNSMSNPVVVSIKQRLVDLRFGEVELENKYPDDSRVLMDLRKRISFAEAELLKAKEEDTRLGTDIDAELELEKLQAQIQVLVAQKQLLKETLEKRKAELVNLTNYEAMFYSLERKVETARIEYGQYRDNYTIAKSSAALDADKVSNIVIVQPATLSTEPRDSKKKLVVALSVVFGLFGGVGLAFVSELLDDTIKTSEDVMKHLALPVLASINYKTVTKLIK